jgi:hypothetical protein
MYEVIGGSQQVEIAVDDDDRGPRRQQPSNTPTSVMTSSGCRPGLRPVADGPGQP